MNISLQTLFDDLRTRYSIRFQNCQDTTIEKIEVLNAEKLLNVQFDRLYVIPFEQLMQLLTQIRIVDPQSRINILCIAEPGAKINYQALPSCCQVLYNDDYAQVLLDISEYVFKYGQETSPLKDLTALLIACDTIHDVTELVGNHTDLEVAIVDSENGIYARSAGFDLDLNALPQQDFPRDRQLLRRNLEADGYLYGYLYIYYEASEARLETQTVITLLCNTCTAILRKHRASEITASHGEDRIHFLLQLLTKVAYSPKSVEQQKRRFFPNEFQQYCLIRLDTVDTSSLPMHLYSNKLTAEYSNCYPLYYEDHVYVFFVFSDGLQEVRRTLSRCDELLRADSLCAGVSYVFSELTQLRLAYVQASKALEIGRYFLSKRTMYKYDDCSIFHVLQITSDFHNLLSFCSTDFLALLDQDTNNGGKLIETLRCYLDNRCNKVNTAEKLGLHPNTVKYRIAQVEEILQMDLFNPDNYAKLQFSFKVLDYISVFPESK